MSLLTVIPFNQITANFDETYLIHGVMNVGDFVVLSGAPNVGKTFLALDWGLHIACGWDWFGRRVEQGAVIYISCEGGRRFGNRVAAFKLRYAEQLLGINHVPFYLINQPVNLFSEMEHLPTLIEACNAIPNLRLIVIDTLSRAMVGADENSPQDMTRFIANIDLLRSSITTKPSTCVLHHTGKDETRGSRGHSSLSGAIDTEIRVRRNKGCKAVTMELVKQRDGTTDVTEEYHLVPHIVGKDTHGVDVMSCTIEPPTKDAPTDISEVAISLEGIEDKHKKGEARAELYMEAVKELPLSTKLQIDQEVREQLMETDGLSYNAARQAVYTAATFLIKSGQLKLVSGKWELI